MAVEIKEIVIKAVLTKKGRSNASGDNSHTNQEEMIQECVAQVLKVLEKKNRR